MLRILVLYSNPPLHPRLRLDREDRIFNRFTRELGGNVVIERHHATDLPDAASLISTGSFDVIQFSGHGAENGLYLDQNDLRDDGRGELVSPSRLRSLISLAERPPLLVVALCCYSNALVGELSDVAPFVVSTDQEVSDETCLLFVKGFYEPLVSGFSIQVSFDHALNLISASGHSTQGLQLTRRSLIKNKGSVFVASRPDLRHDSILVNLDAVKDGLPSLGMPIEQFCHLLERRLTVHSWIFGVPRENALIPIGRVLFGEFRWDDARDVVHCTRIFRLRSDEDQERWSTWSRLLIAYNDLCSCEYRTLMRPADPVNSSQLEDAVQLFEHHIATSLEPARLAIARLGLAALLPHIELAKNFCVSAREQLEMSRWSRAIQSLELALTNYHEVVDGMQPATEVVLP